MQVYVLISGTALPGKWRDAAKALLETAKYLSENKSYVGEYQILRPADGPNKQLYWLCRYQSMADYEKDVELRGKDPGWLTVWAKVDETIDVDNISSQVLRVSQ